MFEVANHALESGRREPAPARHWLLATLLIVLTGSRSSVACAQAHARGDSAPLPMWITAGSPNENYLRYAQSLGRVPLHQWTIRPFTTVELDVFGTAPAESLPHIPVAERIRRLHGALQWQVLPVVGTAWYNSTMPYGWNDGAVWRGRGLTAALEGGVATRWRVISLTLDPLLFTAQNQTFGLMADGDPSNSLFAEPLNGNIDRPQRFGDRAYSRVDPGQSGIRVDAYGITAGISSANQWWGPMSEWPFVLSNNAAGFPNVFFGSSRPWNIGIGRIHGRVFYGKLTQTAYTDIPGDSARRYAGGIIASFMPEFIPGLEIGGGRMFETTWPANGFGWTQLRKPFEPFLKANVHGDPGTTANQSADNQIASLFARWTLPKNGVEVYGEFGRDDHNWNGRDAILEPDQSATVGLGLRKAWSSGAGRITGFRAETFNMQRSSAPRQRNQGGWYANSGTRQGHTEQGQVLGAGFAAISGAANLVAIDRFLPSGERASVSFTRMVMRERTNLSPTTDVMYTLGGDYRHRFRGILVGTGLTATYELDRYFSADVGNIGVSISLQR